MPSQTLRLQLTDAASSPLIQLLASPNAGPQSSQMSDLCCLLCSPNVGDTGALCMGFLKPSTVDLKKKGRHPISLP